MPKREPFFYKKLILWYLQNKRALPWRATTTPYYIWLSEIILQQTRVKQGLPYYLKFVEAFPTIESLARSPEEKILKLWQGLGYYSRARNLHVTAKYIVEQLQGEFPKNYKDLIKLKGVGDYTASAIASICYHEPTAVVDGNVYRVLARIFGIDTPINSSKGIRDFKKLAQQLIDVNRPGVYNQAIMEFGARYCKPHNPNCLNCIFNDTCIAFQKKKVLQLPVKIKKPSVKKRYFNYLFVLSEENKTVLQKRNGKGIWQNLYEFPLFETHQEINLKQLMKLPEYKEFSKKHNIRSLSLYNEESIVHKLSHRHLHTRFWIVEISELKEQGILLKDLSRYPVPVLIENFISTFSVKLYRDKTEKKSYI